jgi:lipoprotein-anchoring transpeptidase ErfK/SrfK
VTVALALLGAGVVVVALAVVARTPAPATPAAAERLRLPEPIRPAFVVGKPQRLSGAAFTAHWTSVLRPAAARAAPSPVARLVSRLSTTTPEGTRNVVEVIGHRQDSSGTAWVQVRLAVLPNGTTGWVRRTALGGYGTVDTQLAVDVQRLRATLYRSGRRVMTVPIGAGAPGWPTPRGEFYIRNRLDHYHSAAYGPVAFGTSARSARATDWPAGGYVGIHGTDRPDLIPGRVSHGCIRMRNADILAMARLMGVGTPVTVR